MNVIRVHGTSYLATAGWANTPDEWRAVWFDHLPEEDEWPAYWDRARGATQQGNLHIYQINWHRQLTDNGIHARATLLFEVDANGRRKERVEYVCFAPGQSGYLFEGEHLPGAANHALPEDMRG
jgi:hypothetical protein